MAEALRDSGSRLGRYVILEEQGEGGMGVVLEAFAPRPVGRLVLELDLAAVVTAADAVDAAGAVRRAELRRAVPSVELRGRGAAANVGARLRRQQGAAEMRAFVAAQLGRPSRH